MVVNHQAAQKSLTIGYAHLPWSYHAAIEFRGILHKTLGSVKR